MSTSADGTDICGSMVSQPSIAAKTRERVQVSDEAALDGAPALPAWPGVPLGNVGGYRVPLASIVRALRLGRIAISRLGGYNRRMRWIGLLLLLAGAARGGDELPLPTRKTTILRDEGTTYFVEGRRRQQPVGVRPAARG